jgi:oligopeptide/dipeptide ABC transporter ATP-binding protein
MIFQNPDSSLNPRMRAGKIVAEPLKTFSGLADEEIRRRVDELLVSVGLPADIAARFPNELSGGERQRISIARALAAAPELLILDEPTSALDVSVQAQTLNLLLSLQRDLGLTYLFLSHDIAVVSLLADDVATMYQGRLCEIGPADCVLSHPRHPYTQALVRAAGELESNGIGLLADPETATVGHSSGCPFAARCPLREPRCFREIPAMQPLGDGVVAACHVAGDHPQSD